jgi:hypothetical protein
MEERDRGRCYNDFNIDESSGVKLEPRDTVIYGVSGIAEAQSLTARFLELLVIVLRIQSKKFFTIRLAWNARKPHQSGFQKKRAWQKPGGANPSNISPRDQSCQSR